MANRPPLLLFSDLDGTLLDHHSYAWDAAQPALDALRKAGCGVVLASSKTAKEIAYLRDEMGLSDWPAIVENGGGLLPAGARSVDAEDYAKLRARLAEFPTELRRMFTGFGDMSVGDVIDATGLDHQAATQAKDRAFSEPGLWSGNAQQQSQFLELCQQARISARRGGRFLTLSFGATKADRMAEVIAQYRPEKIVALGDAPNDVEMIQSADIGVIIRNPDAPALPKLPKEQAGCIIRTQESGPTGWNAAVLSILSTDSL